MKLIYALSDAALVVNSDYRKGGTWAGATEQLDKLNLVPVFVRTDGGTGKGLEGLRRRGAIPWPDPATPEALEKCLDRPPVPGYGAPRQETLGPDIRDGSGPFDNGKESEPATAAPEPLAATAVSPADELFATVRELFGRMNVCRSEAEVAEELQISKKQIDVWLNRFAKEKTTELFKCEHAAFSESEVAEKLQVPKHRTRRCLKRLVEEGAVERLSRPVRYRSAAAIGPLFDNGD